MESSAGDPYRRPARRTQWLLSALAHHYGLDRGVENEIVVLATGLDQYLQEVFHHLDCRGAGRLPRADFRALCAVLGLNADGEAATEDANTTEGTAKNLAAGEVAGGDADIREEARLALRADPPELTFRQFHARLCGYFSSRAGPRLPRGALSEHIETQIRLRRPRRRRRPGSPSLHGDAYGERVVQLEEENSSLRELVEDLRAALQSSDARCLALQVGLWKSQSDIPETAAHELQRAQGALAEAEARARRLQRGQVEVRLRTEEARRAVRLSLHRVRELEALARRVPRLQRQVQRLEAELRRYRSEGPQLLTPPQASPRSGNRNGEPTVGGTGDLDTTPEGVERSDSSLRNRDTDEEEEQLFRSVEGQAASEEEEEERWQEKPGRPQAHSEAPLLQPSSCVSRCDDQASEMLKASFGHCDGAEHMCTPELETHVTRLGEQLQTLGCSRETPGTPEEEQAELQQMVETEHLKLELQMVETERVRLSLLEEKLVDVLQLLKRLRDLNISKRALGKMLLNALDRNPSQEGTRGTLAILDALHQALVGCELLQRNPSAPASTAPAYTNPFLISC
ncbi:EF-hand and coiled-coil domain-containing protein 1 isoform X2 [Apodemus sylvaticus]|uniref:EF-hand and coiled-coil domain-containing protein 1 isoform X2 n=1 Tax=Apodemus sylvaticus TaxID=10129 RepID=UPI002242DDB3|nr:EF-hand and coiled-coil domain-containing protein 1 isoform X2 [Apodemus sylvaticus]